MQCFQILKILKEKINTLQQWVCCKPKMRQAWGCLVFPPPLCLSCIFMSRASHTWPPRCLPQLMHWSWKQEKVHRAAVNLDALRLWQGPASNILISFKPSCGFSCAYVALERQGVAGAYNTFVLILHFSEELQFRLQLMRVGSSKHPFRCRH